MVELLQFVKSDLEGTAYLKIKLKILLFQPKESLYILINP
jgi:hypothetical protein